VPNIKTPVVTDVYKIKEFYSDTTYSIKQLGTIFYPRTYPDEDWISGLKPDFINTVKYLEENQVQFVLVNKTSYFLDDNNNYVYLYSLVYESYDVLYQNDSYILFYHPQ